MLSDASSRGTTLDRELQSTHPDITEHCLTADRLVAHGPLPALTLSVTAMSTTDSTSGPARLRHAGERWLREHQDKMSDSSSTFSDLAGLNSKGALGHVNNELHVADCSRNLMKRRQRPACNHWACDRCIRCACACCSFRPSPRPSWVTQWQRLSRDGVRSLAAMRDAALYQTYSVLVAACAGRLQRRDLFSPRSDSTFGLASSRADASAPTARETTPYSTHDNVLYDGSPEAGDEGERLHCEPQPCVRARTIMRIATHAPYFSMPTCTSGSDTKGLTLKHAFAAISARPPLPPLLSMPSAATVQHKPSDVTSAAQPGQVASTPAQPEVSSDIDSLIGGLTSPRKVTARPVGPSLNWLLEVQQQDAQRQQASSDVASDSGAQKSKAVSDAQPAAVRKGSNANAAAALPKRPSGIPALPMQRIMSQAEQSCAAPGQVPYRSQRVSNLPAPTGLAQHLPRQPDAWGAVDSSGENAAQPSHVIRARRQLTGTAAFSINRQPHAELKDRRESPDSPLVSDKRDVEAVANARADLVTPRLSMSPAGKHPLSQLLAQSHASNVDASPKEGDSELSFAQRLSPGGSHAGSALSAAPRHVQQEAEQHTTGKQGSQSPDEALQGQPEADFHFPNPPPNDPAPLFGSQSLMPGMDCSRFAPGRPADAPHAAPLSVQKSVPLLSPAPGSAASVPSGSAQGSSHTPRTQASAGTAPSAGVTPQHNLHGAARTPTVQMPVASGSLPASVGLLDALSGVTLESPDSVFEGCDQLFRNSATPSSVMAGTAARSAGAKQPSSAPAAPHSAMSDLPIGANVVIPTAIVSPRGLPHQTPPAANAEPQMPQASSLSQHTAASALAASAELISEAVAQQRSPPRGNSIPRTPDASAAIKSHAISVSGARSHAKQAQQQAPPAPQQTATAMQSTAQAGAPLPPSRNAQGSGPPPGRSIPRTPAAGSTVPGGPRAMPPATSQLPHSAMPPAADKAQAAPQLTAQPAAADPPSALPAPQLVCPAVRHVQNAQPPAELGSAAPSAAVPTSTGGASGVNLPGLPASAATSSPLSDVRDPFAPRLRIPRSENGAVPAPSEAALTNTAAPSEQPSPEGPVKRSTPTHQPRSPPVWMPMSAVSPPVPALLAVPTAEPVQQTPPQSGTSQRAASAERDAAQAAQRSTPRANSSQRADAAMPAASPRVQPAGAAPQPAFVSPALPLINTHPAASAAAISPQPSTPPMPAPAAAPAASSRAATPATAASPAAPYAISVRQSPGSPAWRVACFPQRTASLQASPSSPMVRMHSAASPIINGKCTLERSKLERYNSPMSASKAWWAWCAWWAWWVWWAW